MKFVDPQLFSPERKSALKEAFNTALPYRHIVIDNFMQAEIAETLFQKFPPDEKFNKHYKGLNEYKSEGSNFEDFDPMLTELRDEIFSPDFCGLLSEISGIDGLYSVKDAMGAGLHNGGDGSFLDVHIDFNVHVDRGIHRRINLLIFFNKNWKEEYGGHTELWNADMTVCEKKVLPIFNRALIFETNEISYHGYSKIKLPPGESRKSFYTYFYTDLREDAVGYHDTVFKARPTDSSVKKAITPLKEKAKNIAKAILRSVGITWK